VVQGGEETRLHIGPAALVLVLLLGPHEFGILVQVGLLLDQIEGEGRDLNIQNTLADRPI